MTFRCKVLEGNWVECNSKSHRIVAKVFDESSRYGINRGKISKLWVMQKRNGKIVLDYDRGWNVRPKSVKAFTKPVLKFAKVR